MYFLLDKGVIRKALEKLDASNPKKLAVLTSLKLQNQSFKFKKHSENAVNSFNYIVSIFQSRSNSEELREKPVPGNEGHLFKRIKKAVFSRVKRRISGSCEIEKIVDSLSQEKSRAEEVLKGVERVATQKVK